MSKWLRLHMVENETVDIKIEGLGAKEVSKLISADYISGIHPGDMMCYVPQSSVLWMEVIDVTEGTQE